MALSPEQTVKAVGKANQIVTNENISPNKNNSPKREGGLGGSAGLSDKDDVQTGRPEGLSLPVDLRGLQDDELSLLQCTSPTTPCHSTVGLQCTTPVSVPATPQSRAGVQTQPTQGRRRNAPGLLARKVFVGGIPQSMTQKEFYKIISGQGHKVESAWLQLEHNGGTKKHRGFGYVVFRDQHAVDQLLGADPKQSLFIEVGEGKKLEVRRAFGKETPAAADTTRAQSKASAHQLATPKVAAHDNTRAPMSPMTMSPMQASLSFPYVPAFPTSWSRFGFQQPQGTMPMPMPQTPPQQPMAVTFVPVPLYAVPLYPVAPQTPPQQRMVAPASPCSPSQLPNGFVGQQARDPQELESERLHAEAATDRYQDWLRGDED